MNDQIRNLKESKQTRSSNFAHCYSAILIFTTQMSFIILNYESHEVILLCFSGKCVGALIPPHHLCDALLHRDNRLVSQLMFYLLNGEGSGHSSVVDFLLC